MTLGITIKGITILGAMFLVARVYAGDQRVLTPMDKMNYATGVDIVRKLKQQGGIINLDLVIQGMKDELTDEHFLISEDELRKNMTAPPSGLRNELAPQDGNKAGKDQFGIQGSMAKSSDTTPTHKAKQINPNTHETSGSSEQNGSPVSNIEQAAMPNDNLVKGLTQDGTDKPVELGGRLLSDGTIISKRNQAKLRVQEIKAGMREQ